MLHDEMLNKVCRSIDILIQTSDKYEGLFPSVLDLQTFEMPDELPAPVQGQRRGDRSYPGNNLIHDEAALMTMYALASALNRPQYAEAADKYLKRFATHCTDTPTGLFPWGEHAFWNLITDKLHEGAIHDHLRQAPVWLWEKLYEFNPKCISTFAEGLNYHWSEYEPIEYSRHANIEVKAPPDYHSRACDFPRHSGFYILDWSYAYLKTGREDFLSQINKMLDYWWSRRDENGLLAMETRSPEDLYVMHNVGAPGQTLSLGASLLESAELLDEKNPELAAEMRERGLIYINGFLSAPHDIDKRVYVLSTKRATGDIIHTMPVWGSVYGVWPASYVALTCLCAYRFTGDKRLLEWAESVGQAYLEEPIPDDVATPAMDAGLGVGLLADLYEITGKSEWLEGGLALANKLISIYMDGDLPRGAAGINWYESQMGPSFLLHGIARIALLAADKKCALAADYTAR